MSPHVPTTIVPTNTDAKGDEARRSLRPIRRSATANPATSKIADSHTASYVGPYIGCSVMLAILYPRITRLADSGDRAV